MGTVSKILGIDATSVSKILGKTLSGVSKVIGQTIALFTDNKAVSKSKYINIGIS